MFRLDTLSVEVLVIRSIKRSTENIASFIPIDIIWEVFTNPNDIVINKAKSVRKEMGNAVVEINGNNSKVLLQ